jgi:hypothetical protein
VGDFFTNSSGHPDHRDGGTLSNKRFDQKHTTPKKGEEKKFCERMEAKVGIEPLKSVILPNPFAHST